jgi:ATP-binding cassette subfamily D (ALD) long-chain fatty acid import protein
MYAYKDVLELAGLTTRLYTLISSLYALPPHLSPPSDGDYQLEHVDIKVDDHALVSDLSLRIKPGEHLMITGSNGVGKTSVARILAGLWTPSGQGTVQAPHRDQVIVVPQRAYLPPGSLLSQIIYPHTYPEFVASGKTLDDLMQILTTVHLAYLPQREGGWETIKEWRDVLSGGEKQRLGLARVFYHRPKFAVLDEATSAVSSDVEGGMYEAAKKIGVTLITISLR